MKEKQFLIALILTNVIKIMINIQEVFRILSNANTNGIL